MTDENGRRRPRPRPSRRFLGLGDPRRRRQAGNRRPGRCGCPSAPMRARSRPLLRYSPVSTVSPSTPAASAMPSASCCRAGAIPVLIVAGDSVSQRNGRWHIGKARLIGDLLHLARAGRLVVPPECLGAEALRREMVTFASAPTRHGVRLEARGRHTMTSCWRSPSPFWPPGLAQKWA